MSLINALKHQLEQKEDLDYTLVEVAKQSEGHYLGYFMTNLLLEVVTFLEIINEEDKKRLINGEPELKKVVQYIIKSLSDLDKWLNPSAKSVATRISTLNKYRDMLSYQVAAVAAYDDQVKLYDYVLRRRKQYDVKSEDDQRLAGDLIQFIFEFEDSMTINDRVKSVYGQLPVRMSKLKFHEWVEKALVGMRGVSVSDFTNYITYLRETYHPEGVEGYGQVFSGLNDELSGFDVLLTDIVNSEMVEPLEQKLDSLKLSLESSVSLYTYTAIVINNMLGLLSVLNEESSETNQIQKGEFVRIAQYIMSRKDEDMVIDEFLVEEFNHISLSFDHIREQNGTYDTLVETAKSTCSPEIIEMGLSKKYDRLSSLYVLQSNSYFAPLSVEAEAVEVMDDQHLIQMKNELLAYFDDVSKKDTRIQKRARIANLLSVLNVIQSSAEEIHNYILVALGGCKDEREKLGCQKALRDIIAQG